MSVIKIENVSQFMDYIRGIRKQENIELFFRGQANCSWSSEPGIFRDKQLLKNEKNLFNDIITQCPEEFKDCQFTFEYLVKMQHYGLPTRLLDITSNALVALYFACCSLNGKDHDSINGQILIYQVKKNTIKNYNSDTVSVLSNLAQLDNNFELLIKDKSNLLFRLKQKKTNIIKKNDNKFIVLVEKFLNPFGFLSLILNPFSFLSLCRAGLTFGFFFGKRAAEKQRKKQLDQIEHELPLLEKLQKQRGRFLHFIKREKNYFLDNLDTQNDVQKVVCVRAKMNNQRIVRQSSLFFLFGMGKSKNDPISLSEVKLDKDGKQDIKQLDDVELIISADKKINILQELQSLGISEETLMPEIDMVAKSIKNRYSCK